MIVSESRHVVVMGWIAWRDEQAPRSRVPDKSQREALQRRAGTQKAARHDADGWAPALQRTAPDDASHRPSAALRPGHASGVWRSPSPPSSRRALATKQCRCMRRWLVLQARSAVGWAKAIAPCPRSPSISAQGVGTLRFAHPTISSLWHAAQLTDTPSRPRGAFRPSFASTLHPPIQEGAGKAGCRFAPAVRCAKCTRRKNRTAAYRWCRSLGLPCAMVGRLMP
ncbi:hypothetical protein ABH975_006057 [Bradyrhizobium ottawaense]